MGSARDEQGPTAVCVGHATVASADRPYLASYTPPTPSLPDVTADNTWSQAHKLFEHVAEAGVTQGHRAGSGPPENTAIRDQMAVFVPRARQLPL